MLDCDQKVGSRVCANSRRKGDVIQLPKNDESGEQYSVEIKTGCKKKPRRGQRFCDECLAVFGLKDQSTGEVLFLESLHPGQSCMRESDNINIEELQKNLGEG